MNATCMLYLPWLCDQLRFDESLVADDYPELLTLLSRAARRSAPAVSPTHQLAMHLGLSVSADEDIPIAAARLHAQKTVATTNRWCADPVCLQVDRDRAIVMPSSLLQITPQEADALVTALNSHFGADGLRFEAITPQSWILHSSQPYSWQTTAITEAIGRDAREVAVRGNDAAIWRRWQNEIEMLLHAHPVNQHREEQGQWPITGVWLWGGGKWPKTDLPQLNQLYTDDENLRTLAQAVEVCATALPMNLHRFDWQTKQRYAFILLQPLAADQLVQFEAHWLAPLHQAMRSGQVNHLSLHTRQWQFDMDAKQLRHWWRRRRHLAYWCS